MRIHLRFTGIFVGGALVAGLGNGCATIAGLDEDFQHAPVCDPLVPTPAPSIDNAGDTTEFTAAIRSVDLDEGDETPRFGFDMDGKCSCTYDGQGCTRPAYVDSKKETCDDPRGIDNGTGVALARINGLAGGAISSILINDGTEQGTWSLLIRVRDYSGTPEDDHVTVAIYETPGLAGPLWNGMDVWPVSKTSVGSSGTVDDPIHIDNAAYVHNGELVAHLPTIRLAFRSPTLYLPIELISVTVSGKIVQASAGGFRLTEGTLAGIWTHDLLFKGLSGFRYKTNLDSKLCRDDIIYLQVKNYFCSATDVIANPGAGSTECDAVSYGMRFDTESVKLGMVADPLPEPPPACSAGFDPISDKCAK